MVRRDRASGRFTATELVVILVIAVVMVSVLLPSVSQLSVKRDRVDCTQNLMELGVVVGGWSGARDGMLPAARLEAGYWHEQLQKGGGSTAPALGRLLCRGNPGRQASFPLVNYGWNSYLGDVELADRVLRVRAGDIARPDGIILAGDGTMTGGSTAQGVPTVWPQKTWRREADQILVTPPVHGEQLIYLFADLHVGPLSLLDPGLVENPAVRIANNYWVEQVRPAPGPYFGGGRNGRRR